MTINQLPELTEATGTTAIPVNKNGSDYKLPIKNFIKSKSVSGTTSSSGNINLTTLDGSVIVISAIREDAASVAIPFWSYQNDCWAVHLMSANAGQSVVASTAVDVLVYYLDIDFGGIVPN